MPHHRISATAHIPAPASQVYALLADYRAGHPGILPRPPFVSLTVEQGGIGAGTVISFQMRLMGRLQTFRAAVTEPAPGRVLAETDLATGTATTFTVEPRADGRSALVTIATDTPVRAGVLGAIEGWFAARLLRPIYGKELAQLAAVAANPVNPTGHIN
jgi:hypothetical protein